MTDGVGYSLSDIATAMGNRNGEWGNSWCPLPFTITINGSTAQLYNKYHLPIYSNRLCPRKRYCGAYVNNGTDAWVVLFNTPDCPQFASA